MGNNSILITEHRYTPKYDKSALSGKYQTICYFKNDEYGMKGFALVAKCLYWLVTTIVTEDGKFGV